MVDRLEKEIATKARELIAKDIQPHLAAVVVGDDDRFAMLKQRRGHVLGIETSIYRLPSSSLASDVTAVIDFLNIDPSVHGILIQLPLPFKTDEIDQILNTIRPDKDVDGLAQGWAPRLSPTLSDLVTATHGRGQYLPTTAWAMVELALEHKIELKDLLIVGRGRLVGQPLDQLLTQLKIDHSVTDATDKKSAEHIKKAAVILSGTDSPKPIFNRRNVAKDVTIIAAGNEINHESLDGWAKAVTPERGGVGPLTITLLLRQVIVAASRV